MRIRDEMFGRCLLLAAVSVGARVAHAQDATQPSAAFPVSTLSEIIVTGTREKGISAADSAAPVQIVGSEAFQKVGQPDLIQGLAQNLPSFSAQALGGDTGTFTLAAALRGLSPNQTLVLVDGKRRHLSANFQVSPGGGPYEGADTPDLSLIPVSAIDHVEVLQDGAAAQYGSDAIAGVVNIILKDKDHGGLLTASGGQYYRGDGATGDVQVNHGWSLNERGFFNVSGEVRYHGYSQYGGIDYRAQNPDGSVKSSLDSLDAAGVPGASGFPYINKAMGDASYQLYNLFYNSKYDLGGSTSFYSFGSYSHRNASAYENYRLPSTVVTTANGVTTALYPNGFSPRETFLENDFSVTAGLKGAVADWQWDLSSTYGLDNENIWTRDSANASLYADTGSTPTRFYDGRFQATQWTNDLDITRDLNVGLAGPLNFAVGAELRRETFAIGRGDDYSIYKEGGQGYPGFQPSDAGTHVRRNVAGYIDLAAELVRGLHVDLAGRIEHYSDFGGAAVGKLTARYDFSDAFAVRGTFSTGYRAPTLAEEYYSSTTLTPTYAIVVLPVNSPAAAVAGFHPLRPEESHNLSLGAVLHPAPSFEATLDAYQISINDRILSTGYLLGQVGPFVVSQSVLDAISSHGNILGPNMSFVATSVFTNAADTRTRGIDATVSFSSRIGDWGGANWSLGANVNKTTLERQAPLPAQVAAPAFGQTALLGPAALSNLTTWMPLWRVTPQVTVTHERLGINLRINVYDKVSGMASLDGTGVNGTVIEVPVSAVADLDVRYELTRRLTFNIGANNLFNLKPPGVPNVSDGAGGVRPVSGTYVYGGPMIYSPYSFNGGYYYGRLTLTL